MTGHAWLESRQLQMDPSRSSGWWWRWLRCEHEQGRLLKEWQLFVLNNSYLSLILSKYYLWMNSEETLSEWREGDKGMLLRVHFKSFATALLMHVCNVQDRPEPVKGTYFKFQILLNTKNKSISSHEQGLMRTEIPRNWGLSSISLDRMLPPAFPHSWVSSHLTDKQGYLNPKLTWTFDFCLYT